MARSAADALCPAHAPPRVATCVLGGVRTLPRPQVHLSIAHNLVEAFGGNSSVVFNLNLGDADTRKTPGFQFAAIRYANTSQLVQARDALRPLLQRIASDDGSRYLHSRHLKPNHECFDSTYMHDKDNHMRVLKHYANFHGCYEMVEEAEAQLQARFDWVLTVRADVAIYGGLAPYCLWDTEHVHVAPPPTYGEKTKGWRRPPDGSPEGLRWQAPSKLEGALSEPVLIVPRQMARRVLQRPAEIFSSALVGDAVCRDKDAHVPESFFAKVFQLEGVAIRFAAIPAVIVRESPDTGAQCAGWRAVTHGMSNSRATACASCIRSSRSGMARAAG